MTLRLAKNVTIPPKTQTALRLLVPPRFQNKTSSLETYEPIKNQFLMVAGALIHPTNHLTVCCVLNAGKTPQKLRKYTPIARISAIDLNDPYNEALLSIDLRHSAEDSVPNAKTELLSHEQRREYLEKLGLTFDEIVSFAGAIFQADSIVVRISGNILFRCGAITSIYITPLSHKFDKFTAC
jgi:hypothetical protein